MTLTRLRRWARDHVSNILHDLPDSLKAARLEFSLAVTQNPRPSLKRRAEMAQLIDEWERAESAKVAKYVPRSLSLSSHD